jgi:hypothetical protein
MAPAVTTEFYGFQYDGTGTFLYTNPGDFEADYAAAIANYDVAVSDNSIGTNTESNGFDRTFQGNYGLMSNLIDAAVRGRVRKPRIPATDSAPGTSLIAVHPIPQGKEKPAGTASITLVFKASANANYPCGALLNSCDGALPSYKLLLGPGATQFQRTTFSAAPTIFAITLPNDPSLIGLVTYAQAFFNGPCGVLGGTNGIRFVFGLR